MRITRRTTFVLPSVLAVLCLASPIRADVVEIDGIQWTYSIANGEATVVSIPTSTSGAIAIPQMLGDCPVTSIGAEAFKSASLLTSVVVPNSVTSIGYYAFRNCSGLTSITIPDSVTSIENEAFYGCSGLRSITIPNSVTNLGVNAFASCSSANSITILGNVMTDWSGNSSSPFYSCRPTTLTLGGRLTKIGSFMFGGVYLAGGVTVPDGVTSIGDQAFRSCSSLTSITIPDSVTRIGRDAFPSSVQTTMNGVTFVDGWVVDCSSGLTGELDLRSVRGIASSGLCNCPLLSSVLLPDSMASIGDSAFADCSGLTSITIPNGVTSIGDKAFYGCSGLTSITIPAGVTTIGNSAFYNCSGLTSLTIPDSVTSIGNSAFEGCFGLMSVAIPNGVTIIGNYAFRRCSGLSSVKIPDSVANMGSAPFITCPAIKDAVVPGRFQLSSVFPSSYQAITNAALTSGTTSICDKLFYNCSGLTGTFAIPNGVTTIGNYAFYNCSGLTSIVIPDSVETFGNSPFYSCNSITEAWIPQSVMTKGLSSVFGSACQSLQQLHLSSDISNIGVDEFGDCNALTSIDVAAGNESLWVSPTDGCLYDADRKTVFFCPRNATNVALPDGLEHISNYAFQNCSGLTELTIPEGVTTIGTYSFNNCENLGSLVFPDSVTSIPTTAFNGCTALWTSWYCTLGNLTAGGGGAGGETSRISFVATNVVLHYVASSVPSGAVTPPATEGLVNVITEVGVGRAIAISSDWAAQYPGFEAKFGSDFGAALTVETGKRDGAGNPMFVWQDYVAGTDPTDPASVFTASITFDAATGAPVISWSPELSSAEAAKRSYTILGKVRLNDADWTAVDGDAADYNFFKVRVEMK